MNLDTKFRGLLEDVLEKNGFTIHDFEDALEKKADDKGGGMYSKTLDALYTGSKLAYGLSALLGLTVGGTGYMLNKGLQAQDKRVGRKQDELERVNNMLGKLETDYNF